MLEQANIGVAIRAGLNRVHACYMSSLAWGWGSGDTGAPPDTSFSDLSRCETRRLQRGSDVATNWPIAGAGRAVRVGDPRSAGRRLGVRRIVGRPRAAADGERPYRN